MICGIILVDHHVLRREGLKKIILEAGTFDLIGEYTSINHFLHDGISNFTDPSHSDTSILLITPWKLNDGNALSLNDHMRSMIREDCHHRNKNKICNALSVVIDDVFDDVLLRSAFERGIGGWIVPSTHPYHICLALRQIASGQRLVLVQPMFKESFPLDEEEWRILCALARHPHQQHIAEKLFMSRSTLHRRIRTILEKLNVPTIEKALMVAAWHGWISPFDSDYDIIHPQMVQSDIKKETHYKEHV
ncbi:MAG: hypothetical protein RBR24_05455 [Candidatus Carbobacillus sp.]|nr:hypothetical protein [Candidatus Carbobacillus sp.]